MKDLTEESYGMSYSQKTVNKQVEQYANAMISNWRLLYLLFSKFNVCDVQGRLRK
jgi:hypothetical protein